MHENSLVSYQKLWYFISLITVWKHDILFCHVPISPHPNNLWICPPSHLNERAFIRLNIFCKIRLFTISPKNSRFFVHEAFLCESSKHNRSPVPKTSQLISPHSKKNGPVNRKLIIYSMFYPCFFLTLLRYILISDFESLISNPSVSVFAQFLYGAQKVWE